GSSSATIYNPASAVVTAFNNAGHPLSFVGTAGFASDLLPPRHVLTPSAEDLEMALQAKVENEHNLFRRNGVLGVGIGAADDNPLEAVIVIYADQSIPANIPERIDGFRTRVIFTDTIVAQ